MEILRGLGLGNCSDIYDSRNGGVTIIGVAFGNSDGTPPQGAPSKNGQE